ncbi:DNA polymerase III subunit delta' C-terminal domain-containing protein [Legionella longbeachae]|uniref:DNA polymerase III subunit delta' n=1 Tax=Legionella longbeachae serogroup 1 (strain NSW150) TaxID=661367 RepID=D3HSG7_LEGLN|nr:DNA polymerase III subunit delta' [Legionella longbeachae]VEE02350.1 DNA polymerase III, delta' subunit [Legionella oakridgensis]HBD7398159.1 DNA polymerase III subunit delta' [Legionella pneumophila]ARB91365.1 DNA polymerase III subunit delta' [Legionella longbeachae]QIN35562.1 DNA polymerase III subunit delta' [Legionella longbeachae]RZV23611.1 DNA polymerase III subunit delta' [Legionella longbeachae]
MIGYDPKEEKYLAQWKQIQIAWKNGRMPQAMLFVGSLDCALIDFIRRFSKFVFCKMETKPCGECIDCRMALCAEHPDLNWIKPEKRGGSIKIDTIRELHDYSYLTPQRANHRLIVIESVERMNISAANSLLKILEEPAQHILFLLVAQQLSTVLPTILSRCQIMHFASYVDLSNLLQLGERYPQESEQAVIINQAEFVLDGLISVIKEKTHPCIVAAQWSQFEMNTLLWFLYLVYSQIQIIQINGIINAGPATQQLQSLATLLNPIIIFAQIDRINALQMKLSHNINVNQTLALEDLLLAIHSE